jgi:MinD-like ATPase involved in chromosome partitioning or flagellar assembly
MTNLIATFYSYKGGVGRTMALANLAIILARLGRKVLIVDLDLEAPGLDRYFTTLEMRSSRKGGMIDLLLAASKGRKDFPDWHDYISAVLVEGQKIALLSAGTQTIII